MENLSMRSEPGLFAKPILQTKDLSVGYQGKKGTNTLESSLNIKIYNGELACLIGPNGCGKSTLMRTIAGLQKPLTGETIIAETDVKRILPHQYAKLLSLVLTDKVGVGAMKVCEVVAIGRYPHTNYFAKLQQQDHDLIAGALESVHLEHYADRFFYELSDGEKQRVMIAKALAQDTPLLILDEPTAHLDLPNRVEIMNILKQLAKKMNKAILLSTHELDLALQTADTVWLMHKNEPLKSGAPEDLVLSGAFEMVFKSDAFQFDKDTGSFKVLHSGNGTVALFGDGVKSAWTRRALQRDGYHIADKAGIQIHVDERLWTLEREGRTTQCESIGALLCELRATFG